MSDEASPWTLSKQDGESLHFNEHRQCMPDVERASNTNPTIDLRQTHTTNSRDEVMVASKNIHGGQDCLPPATCPSMGQGKAIPSKLPNPDAYLVEFDGPGDPLHPINWKLSAK